MRRHEGLRLLSEDHHHALVEARHLKRAGTEEAKLGVRETAERFVGFWEKDGQLHFRREEEILLPAYSAYGQPDAPAIVTLLTQHMVLRRKAWEVGEALRGDRVEVETLRELGQLFEEHVRHEERVAFPLMEEAMPEEVLQWVGVRLAD